jgi:hypothetical protein
MSSQSARKSAKRSRSKSSPDRFLAPSSPKTASSAGATQSAVVAAKVAVRGAVQKTFTTSKILSGFTDATHLEMLVGEYLATLDDSPRQSLVVAADASRVFVAGLQPFQPSGVVKRTVNAPHVDAIRAEPYSSRHLGRDHTNSPLWT